MGTTFNLIDDPWIVIRTVDGDSEVVSIRDAFARSADIRRIAGDLPTQDFAVLRILLAILYQVFRERAAEGDRIEVFEGLWESGDLPIDEIDRYLEHWHGRFDLFDETHPFMQVAGLASTTGEAKPLGGILIPDSPGDNSLFTMSRNVRELDYGTAARWLVHCQAYDYDGIKTGISGDPRTKGGRGYPIGIGWTGWLGGLYLEGSNLRETLLLNWSPPDDHDAADRPLWERQPLTPAPRPSIGTAPCGPLDLFTWPVRHIRLIPDGDAVRQVLVGIGEAVPKAWQLRNEPMTAWRLSPTQMVKEKSGGTPLYMPRSHDHSRSMWRGLAALLPDPKPAVDSRIGHPLSYPAQILDTLGHRSEVLPDRMFAVGSVGVEYGANMSSFGEIFTDRVVLHPGIAVAEGNARAAIVEVLDRTDRAVAALASLAGDLAIAGGGDRAPAMTRARERGYAVLDQYFRQWLPMVRTDCDFDDVLNTWYRIGLEVLAQEADALLDQASPRTRAVKIVDGKTSSAGQSVNWFHYNVRQHLPYRKDAEEWQ